MVIRIGTIVVISLVLQVIGGPAKISSSLEESLKINDRSNIVLVLESTHTVLAQFKSSNFATRGERRTVIANSLKAHAQVSQVSLLEFLSSIPEIIVKNSWITNRIFVRNANASLVEALAQRSEIVHIREEKKGINKFIEPINKKKVTTTNIKDIQWGLERVDVLPVWNAGINGTGVRVGILDTGVRLTHEALRHNYVGEYGWYAPLEKTKLPEDKFGHGTHVMGTIVGSGGIGVAPGAQWMACQNNPGDECEDIACGEFMLCPTLPDGSNPDCTKSADIVSNSWGYLTFGGGDGFFDEIFAAWDAAGIVHIFSAGNDGPKCRSLRTPGDSSYPTLITVGSTDIDDNLSTFTSFGPSYLGPIKPNIVAPGTDIYSAGHKSDDAYELSNGTSMAAPHVAGVVALILSAQPNATIKEVTTRLYEGARKTISQSGINCGNIPENVYPNNHVGYGLVNAPTSVF